MAASLRLRLFRYAFNCRNDPNVCAAAAQIAAHVFSALIVGRCMPFAHARDGRHDLAGRAIPALQCIVIDESTLHRVQVVGPC